MHGGVKFYRGSAAAARSYVEADRSRADDYYLAEGTGLASWFVATPVDSPVVREVGSLNGPAYERWVAGYDVETGQPRGRLRQDAHGLRFVEVVVNGPKTWSLAAAVHPEIAAAYDAAQDKAAAEIIRWLADHSTTRVGPRGRQVQVSVEQLEAAVVRHYTSRAGDPHRHLHLQINARVFAACRWRGLHSVAVVDNIEAINGIGHAAVACNPEFRGALVAHGYTLDPDTGEITQLTPYAGAFSARAAQITRTIDRYEAQWRREHPSGEPGPALQRIWDRRAWAHARPDKVVPRDGAELGMRWVEELQELGFTPPPPPATTVNPAHDQARPRLGTPIGRVNRDAIANLVLSRLAARRSSWNAADIRGGVERIVAGVDIVAVALVRQELAEDLTSRAVERCVPLLDREDVPEHVRALTSPRVLEVEAELTGRLTRRAEQPVIRAWMPRHLGGHELNDSQREVVSVSAGASLMVIEGAAGAGKSTTLAAARELLAMYNRRLIVVAPTLKAARVAEEQVGTVAFSAAWLIYQHGYRWDQDGRWSRVQTQPDQRARLHPGDVLLVDEAGMLDQDTALALLTIADETNARVAFVGDRHQLPAVGRGGVLDHAARWAQPEACLTLDAVHRFTDPEYAELTLLMRTGERPGEVFDALLERGLIAVYPTDVERQAALTSLRSDGGRVIADTREQVAALNAAIRDRRVATGETVAGGAVTNAAGDQIGLGDQIATRRNDCDLGVANRDRWTVAGIDEAGGLRVRGRAGDRSLPSAYVRQHVELAYATTVHGTQGETVDRAHLVIGESTGAAAAYVGMTRGRERNTAHLVAETTETARTQWIEVFSRDRADLGPGHAARAAAGDVERYGNRALQRLLGIEIPTPEPSYRPPRMVHVPQTGTFRGPSR